MTQKLGNGLTALDNGTQGLGDELRVFEMELMD